MMRRLVQRKVFHRWPTLCAEHQARYREDCQRIFEVQNKVLASDEILSSDDEETSSEEEEEAERKKLQKVMMDPKSHKKEKEELLKRDDNEIEAGQVLRITRTFKNAAGVEYTR